MQILAFLSHAREQGCSRCVGKHVLLDLAHHDYPLKHLVQLVTRKRAESKKKSNVKSGKSKHTGNYIIPLSTNLPRSFVKTPIYCCYFGRSI